MPQVSFHAQKIAKCGCVDGKRTRWSFDNVPGLQLDCSVSKGKEKKVWRCRYQVGKGVNRKYRTEWLGTFDSRHDPNYLTAALARSKSNDILRAARLDNRDPFAEARATPSADTLSELYEKWLTRHVKVNLKPSSSAEYQSQWRLHVGPRLGDVPLVEIDRNRIIDALEEIREATTGGIRKGRGVQANKCKLLISSIFSWALNEGLHDRNPAHGIKDRVKKAAKIRPLKKVELTALWHRLGALSDNPRDALRLQILLGRRVGEIANAKRIDFDLIEEQWTVLGGDTKSGETDVVPLPPQVLALVKAILARHSSQYLFPQAAGDKPMNKATPSHWFTDLARELEIRDANNHNIRDTVAVNLQDMSFSDDIISRVLSHTAEINKRTLNKHYSSFSCASASPKPPNRH